MKYYSEVLDELFETEEELTKAEIGKEIEQNLEKMKAKEAQERKEELQKEIQESYDYFCSLIKEYTETYKEPIKITIPKSDFESIFDDFRILKDLFFM